MSVSESAGKKAAARDGSRKDEDGALGKTEGRRGDRVQRMDAERPPPALEVSPAPRAGGHEKEIEKPRAMTKEDYEGLSESERRHFYKCATCGEMVDKRQLDDVLFHEDHVQRPDIPYSGSEQLS